MSNKLGWLVIWLILQVPTGLASLHLEEACSKFIPPDNQFLQALSQLQDPAIACAQVWQYTHGQREQIVALFKQAENYPCAQVFLASAYWHAANINYLQANNILFCASAVEQMQTILTQAGLNSENQLQQIRTILHQAKAKGSVYAHLMQLYAMNCPGFIQAAILRPYLDHPETCFDNVLFLYGIGLVEGTPVGSRLFYEGLRCVLKTRMILV